uniref:DNA mismatch repair protein MSH2 n=1 Tax=Ciona savignyi TaxID=51511 RepID=H2YRN3_CIOSA
MANLQAKSKWSIDDEIGFFSFYKSLPEKADTTYRVFEHGEFYSTHEKDAILAAKHIFKSVSAMKELGRKGVPSVFLSQLNFESLARDLLLVMQYRLEVYRQLPNRKWELAYKGSPGYLNEVEEILFKNVDIAEQTSSAVIAVKYILTGGGQSTVGLAFADSRSCELMYAEFSDNDHFSNLESAIIQLGPKECIVQKLDSTHEAATLTEVIKRSRVLITERPKSDFSMKNIDQDLKRLLKTKKKKSDQDEVPVGASWTSDHPLAASSLSSLIHYLELLSKDENFGEFRIRKFDLSQFMKLDSAAYSALNLFPERNTQGIVQHSKPVDSLYGVLNNCQTVQGQRLLTRWIKQPLIDVNHLEERLSVVEAFVEISELRRSLADEHLKKLPDFDRLSKKFHRKKASLQDSYRVYQAIKQLPYICESMEKHAEELESNYNLLREMFIAPIRQLLLDFEKFTEMLDSTLDFKMVGWVERHEYMVKCDFDPELQRLRSKMTEVEEEMEEAFTDAATQLKLEKGKTIKLELAPQFGYVFRVTCKEEKALRQNKRFTTLDTNKAGVSFSTARNPAFTCPPFVTRFINSQLQQLSDGYQDLRASYEAQQDAVVTEIMSIACGYAEPMHTLGDVLAKLDVLLSFAQPLGTGSNLIKLDQCRHPCVERQDDVSFIANDVLLKKEEHNFIIVTVGVAVLMAQIGCFVPCDSVTVTLVDAILARVGAGDCQSSSANSLIIVDELGRGTSTYDGFGLAWAISRHVALELKSACLFATHFHEMTSLADEVPSAVNYHVTALTSADGNDGTSLTMLYQVRPGSCDRSFGIHVAECVDFPRSVINAAKRKAAELEDSYVTGNAEDGDGSDRRKVKLSGQRIVQDFLHSVKREKWNELSDSEAAAKLSELKRKATDAGNEYVDGILRG